MRFVILICLLLIPATARAEWLQASSAHFVVYADDSERNVRRFADRLERYHSAMAYITGVDMGAPSPSNRVTVYVVDSARAVRTLAGDGNKFLSGFYVPRAGGSLAIVPKVSSSGSEPDISMIVLLHEYAHHFMTSTSTFPSPRWMSEGSAEFLASASFDSDGTVELGKIAKHRAAELMLPNFARDVHAADLIDPTNYDKRTYKGYDAFYGKSWLLYHYLTFDKVRAGQRQQYVKLLVEGKSSREAGLAAFGDFDRLEADLDRYAKHRGWFNLKLTPDLLKTGPVEIRPLGAGEAAMMPIRVRSRRGVDEDQAKTLLVEARAVAARYPGDPAVLAALAEAEHDAGNDKEAVAAADAALAKDKSQVNAYIQKGLSLLRMAADAKPGEYEAAYARARRPFLDLNRIEHDHPLPLFYNYRIALEQGITPSANALLGLERAAELAPFDLGLRMTLAMQQIRFGKREEARKNLIPIAYNPHGGGLAQVAQQAIARLAADPKWDGSGMPDPAAVDAESAGSQGPGGETGE